MENSTQANALKAKLQKMNDEQINGILLNVSENCGVMNLEQLIDDLFWSRKWRLMTDTELTTESNRLAEWFSEIWFTQSQFSKAVEKYFKSNLQPENC